MQVVDAEIEGRCAVGPQIVRDQSLGNDGVFPQKLAHQFQRGMLVALGLDQHIQNLALGVDGAPQVNHAPIDFQIDLVKMPDRMRFGTALAQFRCNDRPEMIYPTSDCLVRNCNSALGEQILDVTMALSRCHAASAKCRRPRNCQAAATAVRHVVIAAARSTRCVWAEVRWRWTLKVLWTAACVERNFWAEPGLLNRCILRSRRRVGWCEFSARLFFHRPRSCRRSIPRSRTAALYDRKSSVTNRSGTKACFFRSLRISFSAACLLRFDWTSTSRTSPSASTARQR